jgi:hypothetical protein
VEHAYLYYRIDPAQADLAATRIDWLLNAMRKYCSQPPRRLNRCDDPHMWMEIYEGIADFAVFATALNEAVRMFNCTGFIRGERHLECFSTPPMLPNQLAR